MQTLFIPREINDDGFNVPLNRTLTGFNFLPEISFSKNSFSPRLILYKDHFLYKVIIEKSAKYSDIEKVDAAAYLAKNLTLYFEDSVFRFTAQFNQREDLIELLKFFQQKSLPLTHKALVLIEKI